MPSLLVIVFILQLVIHLVNTVGAATINNLLYNLYSFIVLSSSKEAAEQRQLKSTFLKIRQELNATSSQDEFAKWAKLRRQHDKLLEQLEKTKSSTDASRATFDRVVTALRWLGTNGLRFLLNFWFSKQPMFWIPQGWVPYYAEWLLSFPRAPLGSISIQAWSLACGAVILLASDTIVAIVGLMLTTQSNNGSKGKPMKVASEKASSEKQSEPVSDKKEL
ncbi:protein get1 [Xylogone sp. PMI_703]|nr:protein get1 [Xylogone sp. PMI_703]